MTTLRSRIIKLASEHLEFRKDLLPLLKDTLPGKTAAYRSSLLISSAKDLVQSFRGNINDLDLVGTLTGLQGLYWQLGNVLILLNRGPLKGKLTKYILKNHEIYDALNEENQTQWMETPPSVIPYMVPEGMPVKEAATVASLSYLPMMIKELRDDLASFQPNTPFPKVGVMKLYDIFNTLGKVLKIMKMDPKIRQAATRAYQYNLRLLVELQAAGELDITMLEGPDPALTP